MSSFGKGSVDWWCWGIRTIMCRRVERRGSTFSEPQTWLQFLRLITAAGLTGCEYPDAGQW
jgi:hypothetical protein